MQKFEAGQQSITYCHWLLVSLLILWFISCHSEASKAIDQQRSIDNRECITVMSLNAQHLGVGSRLSAQDRQMRIERLVSVIKDNAPPSGPDILLFQEIKDDETLLSVAQALQPKEYHGITAPKTASSQHTTGILTRLEIIKPFKILNVEYQNVLKRRPILDVELKLPWEASITVAVVHGPMFEYPLFERLRPLETLNFNYGQISSSQLVLAAGDFNIPLEELKQSSNSELLTKNWIVGNSYRSGDPPGTFYFEKEKTWLEIDWMLLSKAFSSPDSTCKLPHRTRLESVKIAASHKEQRKADGTPLRYSSSLRSGVSDHLPLLGTFCECAN